MSIVSVRELFEGRDGGINEKGQRTYTRVFQVITDNNQDGPLFVRLASGVPRIGDVYATNSELDLGATVRKVDPQQSDNPKVWEIRVSYDSATDQEQKDENPLLRPLEISYDSAHSQRAVWQDTDGKAILNSAMQYFDPPVEMDDSRPIITIVRNEASFNPSLAIDYQDAVNTDAFLGFQPGQVKVAKIASSRAFENNVRYWKTTYEFHMRREGWVKKILDQGRYELHEIKDSSGTPTGKMGWTPIPEHDKDGKVIKGSHVTDPVPLDKAGKALPFTTTPNPADAKYMEYKVYKERPFAAFSF